MDRDLAAASQRAGPSLLDPSSIPASFPIDDGPALYRPAHSPPCEPASSSAAPARRKAADEAGRRRLRSGGAPRRSALEALPDSAEALARCEGGGGSGDGGGGGGDGGGGVYTQLQTELSPHMNFF